MQSRSSHEEDPTSSADHLWRFTPWRRVRPDRSDDPSPVEPRITALDGTVMPEGVTVEPVGTPLLEEHLTTRTLAELHPDTWRITASKEPTPPIMIHLHANGHVVMSRLRFDVPPGGELEVVIRFTGEAGWFGCLLEGTIGPGGALHLGTINRMSNDTTTLRSETWHLDRDARLTNATLSVGGGVTKSDLRHDLQAPGASVNVLNAVHGEARREEDAHVEIRHRAPNTMSHAVHHAACGGRSRNIGTGRLTIDPGSHGSDGGQVYRNLLLSDRTLAEAIPELEVLADDVRANHGAASAPIDPGMLHYLESRGLDPQQATDLVVEGFLMSTFGTHLPDTIHQAMETDLKIHLSCDA